MTTIRVEPLSITVEHCVLKNQIILLRTLGEEAFGATALRPKFGTFMTSAIATPCFAADSV